MTEQGLRDLWAELEHDLQALRAEFPKSELGSAARKAFDEYLSANEFGLALETLCDFLLDRDEPAIASHLFEEISRLHARIHVNDNCVTLLQQKFALRGV
jgi:hypothetical protein